MWMSLMLLAGVASAQESPCDRRTRVADLEQATQNAMSAFVAMDVTTFRAFEAEARVALACLDEQLSAKQAAAVHRLFAMGAFLSRDSEGAISAFRASRSVDPSGRVPAEVAPDGHPLDQLFDQANPLAAEPEPLTVPPLSSAYVDGSLATARPTTRPAVVQLSQSGGIVVDSRWLAPGDPVPDWTAFAPDEPDSSPAGVAPAVAAAKGPMPTEGAEQRSGPGPRLAVFALAAGSAAASAGLYATAASSRSEFEDTRTPFEELEPLRKKTNGLIAASGVAAGGAVVLGTVGIVGKF